MKSKLFGEMREGQILSAVVSLSVAFLIFGYPILVGFTFGTQLSAFFTQLSIIGLLFIVALIFASMFYPDFPKMLSEKLVSPNKVYLFIGIAFLLFVTSGLVGVFTQSGDEGPNAPRDIILIVAGIIIFVVVIMIAAASVGGEQK
ncbi:MAG: hypothetical protein HY361_02300 [Candidatus Aenigmarchaeota archaeon]|nr:hypothetical protein [Candidatus Aenigmarchaeota archaeon]